MGFSFPFLFFEGARTRRRLNSSFPLSTREKQTKNPTSARDEAADFKCKGGMMDCDGDRREFAKNQTKNFLARGKGMVLGSGGSEAAATTAVVEKK